MNHQAPKTIPVFAYERKPEERNTRQAQAALEALGPLSGALNIQELTLASGDNTVYHGAGRAPSYRLVLYQNAAATFYDKAVTDQTWVINSSAAVTVRVLFF